MGHVIIVEVMVFRVQPGHAAGEDPGGAGLAGEGRFVLEPRVGAHVVHGPPLGGLRLEQPLQHHCGDHYWWAKGPAAPAPATTARYRIRAESRP